jgi:hypothetical protein
MFLPNVDWLPADYTILYSRRYKLSVSHLYSGSSTTRVTASELIVTTATEILARSSWGGYT